MIKNLLFDHRIGVRRCVVLLVFVYSDHRLHSHDATFWTSRGHGRCPAFPSTGAVHVLVYFRAEGSLGIPFPRRSTKARFVCQLALSRFQCIPGTLFRSYS